MKTLYFILLTLVFVVFSCEAPQENTKPLTKGLASPVYMSKGETEVFLTDYILNVTKIDSIKESKYYKSRLSDDKTKIYITPTKYFKFIQNLTLFVAGTNYDIPLFKNTNKKAIFSIPKNGKNKNITFKSQIVGWQSVPMEDKITYWEYKTDLSPGKYQYLFVVDGKEQLDPNNPKKVGNGMGGFNSVLEIADKSDKTPFLISDTQSGNTFTIKSENVIEEVLVYIGNQLLSKEYVKIGSNAHELIIDIPETIQEKTSVRVFAYNFFGRGNDMFIPINKGKVINNSKDLTRTDFHTQIMYFLLVDRFLDGDKSNTKPVKSDSILPKANYMGGDLQGVIDEIEAGYFTDLGVNTIWLSPITQNPEGAFGFWPDPVSKFSGYHGYWPVSNTKIDYRFGDDMIFQNLLDKAHDKNCNVLLDYVANHIHQEHPLYKQHPDWATSMYLPDGTRNLEKWDSHRLTTWFDTFLPTLDFSKHEVVETMTDSAAYWVTKFDLDGFRHDATKHIQLDFWRTLTNKVKNRTDRPIYQIGETYGSPDLIRSYVNTGMLDGQFNFNLYDASVAVFAKDDEPISRLSDALKESLTYYGSHHLMGNITGNQDRARFISYASGDVKFDEDAKKAGWTRNIEMSDTTAYDKLAMLHAFNLTTPGIPCIYYGDEYGSIGANDPDNRRMMKFSGLDKHELALKEKVTELIHLRKNSMALLYGSTSIKTDGNVLIIKRQYFDEIVYSIFNKSDKIYTFNNHSIQPASFEVIKITK
jgi:glycosidase